MLKRSVAVGLLCIAGHAYSSGEIHITTTQDEDVDNDTCSLREAVEYINQGMPEAGYHGCGGKDSSAIILLEADKTYQLKNQLKIKKTLQLKTTYTSDSTTTQYGLKNATIQMTGTDRLFYIYNDDRDSAQYIVSFIEVNLQGNPDNTSTTQGGLIFNRETLNLQYVKLLQGRATKQGGAIYNEGLMGDTNAGYVTAVNVLFQNNTAAQGAVIYSEIPRFNIYQSVIRNNVTTSSSLPSLFYSAADFDLDLSGTYVSSRKYGIKNSSIFNNTGYISNVRDGMLFNNLTILKNSLGFYLQAPKGNAYIANSILVGNSGANCSFSSGDNTKLMNNLTNTADCGTGNSSYPNVSIANNTLLAGETEGTCSAPPAAGLLCPFATPEKQFLGYFKPRLLMSYKQITDSLIVNKGRVISDGTTLTSLASCESLDQRGKTRSSNELCDIGSIELMIDTDSISTAGVDIRYGQKAEFSIAAQLGDSELVPASACDALLGQRRDGTAWQAGCVQIIQTNTASKGSLVLDQTGQVVYTPNGNWHGSDEFKIRVVTTITRFSDSVGNRYIDIPARIVQAPPDTFEDKSVDTKGGAVGYIELLILLGLIGVAYYKRQDLSHEKY